MLRGEEIRGHKIIISLGDPGDQKKNDQGQKKKDYVGSVYFINNSFSPNNWKVSQIKKYDN